MLDDVIKLLYPDNIQNTQQEQTAKVIIGILREQGIVAVNELQKAVREKIGFNSNRSYYKVMKRLKDVGLVRIKTYRNEDGKRKRYAVLTVQAFDYFIRQRVLRWLMRE